MGEDETTGEAADPALDVADLEPRRYPSTIGGVLYVLMLLVMLVGVVLAAVSDWRLGVHTISVALVVAGLARLGLPEKDAGMLAVRHRFLDVSLLVVVGLVLFVLASTIPDQPG